MATRRGRHWHLLVVALMVLLSVVLLPLAAAARQPAPAPTNQSDVGVGVTVICLGTRGATVVFSVVNRSATTLTLWELVPTFTFSRPSGMPIAIQVFLTFIPTEIAPGATWTYVLPMSADVLPPERRLTFRRPVDIDVELWFLELSEPVVRRFEAARCANLHR
jgi:hypothetical protein